MFLFEIINRIDEIDGIEKFILKLYVTRAYPLFEQKLMYHPELPWNVSKIQTGYVELAYNDSESIELELFQIKIDVKGERNYFRGFGLMMLKYVLNAMIQKYPIVLQTNPEVILTALPLDAEAVTICNPPDYRKFRRSKLALSLQNKTLTQKNRILYKYLLKHYSKTAFNNEIKHPLSLQPKQFHFKFMFRHACGIHKLYRLVHYYENLSFKVVPIKGNPQMGMLMTTDLHSLLRRCDRILFNLRSVLVYDDHELIYRYDNNNV